MIRRSQRGRNRRDRRPSHRASNGFVLLTLLALSATSAMPACSGEWPSFGGSSTVEVSGEQQVVAFLMDGPEGSTIWMAAHCVRLVDKEFAEDQYRRARKELGRKALGFGYGREWPASWVGPMDVDSGPVIPVLGVSAGSSGLAFVGAGAFEDEDYVEALAATLDFAAFPSRRRSAMPYAPVRWQ